MDFNNSKTKAEALDALFEKYHPQRQIEIVSMSEAIHRIPAQDIYSCNTLPVHRVSMMDGIHKFTAAPMKIDPVPVVIIPATLVFLQPNLSNIIPAGICIRA